MVVLVPYSLKDDILRNRWTGTGELYIVGYGILGP